VGDVLRRVLVAGLLTLIAVAMPLATVANADEGTPGDVAGALALVDDTVPGPPVCC
jgi:hypothetical protein